MTDLTSSYKKITGYAKENATSFLNVGIILITFGGEQLFNNTAFNCPCTGSSHVLYGTLFLAAPAVALLVVGLLLSTRLWRIVTGSVHRISSTRHSTTALCYHVFGIITQACVAPIAWLFVGFLDGSYYTCAVASTPCDKTSPSYIYHKATSQMIAWYLLAVTIAIGLIGLVITRACSKFTYHQYKYVDMYTDLEDEKFDAESKARAKACVERNVKLFFENKNMSKEDWDARSRLYWVKRQDKHDVICQDGQDPEFTSLQKWARVHREQEGEETTNEQHSVAATVEVAGEVQMTKVNETEPSK